MNRYLYLQELWDLVIWSTHPRYLILEDMKSKETPLLNTSRQTLLHHFDLFFIREDKPKILDINHQFIKVKHKCKASIHE